MKIYFAGSIRAGRDDAPLYAQIIKHLQKYGEVLTEHVGSVDELGEKGITEEKIFERDMKWLKEADLVVAEITTPSLGVGYELAKAEDWKKKNLCLYRPQAGKKLSGIMIGCKNILVKEYNSLEEAIKIIDEFVG